MITTTEGNNDSLKKRYIYKLGSNIFGLFISLITQTIIPRGLGPKSYGDYNFITNFFMQLATFLDMGTSVGFYTKLSQRQKDSGLVSFYLLFASIVSLSIIALTLLAGATSLHIRLWPDQGMAYIYLGAIWGVLYWTVSVVMNAMVDAYGITVSAEVIRIVQKVIGLTLACLMYIYHQLTLTNIFYYQFILFLLLGASFIWIIKKNGYALLSGWRLRKEQISSYVREFYVYSHPLFSYALVQVIVGIFDRWLLQTYSGSTQQGYYSLSYQISALCFLSTNAMTPLLMREFSIAFSHRDLVKIAALFRRYIPLLYTTAAFFSCFIVLQARSIVDIMGGDRYQGAYISVIIMSFYAIHMTYAQLSGALFFATDRTALYRNVGILFMIIGIPITYLLVAPKQNMGLGAGASGLALKMTVVQFLFVNAQLYFNASFLNISFLRYFGHQIISVVSLLIVAAAASFAVTNMPALNVMPIMSFITAGIVYTLLVVGLVYYLPVIFGLRHDDIQAISKYIRNKFAVS